MRTLAEFRAHAAALGLSIAVDDVVESGPDAPLAQPRGLSDGFVIGNRFCAQPMEGWDGTATGEPTKLTLRRWRNFGRSGAKLIWGCEAVAVEHGGRANPRQLLINQANLDGLRAAREAIVAAHEAAFGRTHDLLIGLQLTHSGRYARPNVGSQPEPQILYHHPLLDERLGFDEAHPVLTDAEIGAIVGRFVDAAELAQEAGFGFVDIKHCHGYLGHEFLTAYTRCGPYGGSFANRTRFLREIVAGVRRRAPGLRVGVRLSAFDAPPYRPGSDGVGTPETASGPYPFLFGAMHDAPLELDLSEVHGFLRLLADIGVELVNVSAGNPYTTPHIIRPALFPPSDGYLPPEDPLAGVARQMRVVADLKARAPDLVLVGSAYTYLQEYLAHAAQHTVRTSRVDFVGLGRMMLAYPQLPADILAGHPLDRRRICRTFSDCTTAPRAGMVSGCYPLDPYYGGRPEAQRLLQLKRGAEG